MKKDIILAGVGGQGILTISYLICNAALDKNMHFKQAEVHGMAQRGGAVQSHLRISNEIIRSDLIPKGQADVILSVEPLEVFRYTDFLKPDGWIITSLEPYINISDYPDMDTIINLYDQYSRKILIDSKPIAQNLGSIRTQNIIMLGASTFYLGFKPEDFDTHIRNLFIRKGEKIVEMNQKAIREGHKIAAAKES